MLVKDKKKLLFLIPALLVLLAGVYCLFRFWPANTPIKTGWQNEEGSIRYLDENGSPLVKWQRIDGYDYYFHPESGIVLTGWQDIDGERYYFNENGIRQSQWMTLDEKTYYLGQDGKAVSGLQTIGNALYYFDADYAVAAGWQDIDGNRYYFQADGTAATGWYDVNDAKYYFDEGGKMGTGWLERENKRYYLGDDGAMVTGWLTLEEDRYYFKEDGRMAIGEVVIDDISRFFTSTGKYVIMPNPWHPVPKDYEIDLVDIEGYEFAREGRDPLQAMMNDCRDAGHVCEINNSYRSYNVQKWLWDDRVAKRMAEGMTYEEACEYTARSVAYPGHSEHQTGLAVDITGTDEMYEWFYEHCWDYGFIIRYPEGKRPITGIIYEPWHFRYVGTELSLELKELNLCMEEYMEMLTQQQAAIA